MDLRTAQKNWDRAEAKMTQLQRDHKPISDRYLAGKATAAEVQKSDDKIKSHYPAWKRAMADLEKAKRDAANHHRTVVVNVNNGGTVGYQSGTW